MIAVFVLLSFNLYFSSLNVQVQDLKDDLVYSSSSSSSSSPKSHHSSSWKADQNNSYISYWISSGTTSFLCGMGHPDRHVRESLHSEMQPYFNFSTSFTTNLKILVLGDSTGNNIFDMLVNSLRLNANNVISQPHFLERGGGPGSGKDVVMSIFNNNSQGQGSGAIAHQRIIGMFLREYEGWAPANWNKGWKIRTFLYFSDFVSNFTQENRTQHHSQIANKKTIHLSGGKQKTIQWKESGKFDALVFKIPSPSWVSLEGVTPDTIQESIELAHDLLGVRVVILVSLHFCNSNDAKATFLRQEVAEKNQMLFDFARNWTKAHGRDKSGIRSVYVLDSGRLNNELMEWNARLLGIDTVHNNHSGTFHFTTKNGESISQSAAQVCGKYPDDNGDCVRNSITEDGMHFCIHTLGPRYAAGVACQLQCAYPPTDSDGWDCSQICNDRFMSAKGK